MISRKLEKSTMDKHDNGQHARRIALTYQNDVDPKRLPRRYSRGYWPLAGAALTGTAGVVAAATIGVPEILLGMGIGYVTYEVMRHRMGVLKALRAAAKLERQFFGP